MPLAVPAAALPVADVEEPLAALVAVAAGAAALPAPAPVVLAKAGIRPKVNQEEARYDGDSGKGLE